VFYLQDILWTKLMVKTTGNPDLSTPLGRMKLKNPVMALRAPRVGATTGTFLT